MTRTSDETSGKIDYGLMRRLLSFLRPYRFPLSGAVILTLSASALGPLRPYLTRIAINDHIVKGDIDGLWTYVGLIIGFLILQGALQYVLSLLMSWVGQKVLYDIRNKLYQHVQRLALRFYDTTPVGRIVTRVTKRRRGAQRAVLFRRCNDDLRRDDHRLDTLLHVPDVR